MASPLLAHGFRKKSAGVQFKGVSGMDYEERVPNEKLIRARLEKGWTQARLAEEVGTTFETVSRWERGVVIPGLFYREKLFSIFGKTAAELGLELADTASLSSAGSTRIVFLA